IVTKQPVDFTRVLIRHQTKVQFGDSACRNRGLDAGPLITADDATYCKGGTDCRSLVKTIAGFAPWLCRTGVAKHPCIRGTDLPHVRPLLRIRVPDAIVEARYGDAAPAIMQSRNYFAERLQWVVTCPAKNARMQFPLRASCFEFDAQAAPERIGDRRTARAGDLRVGNNRAIGC